MKLQPKDKKQLLEMALGEIPSDSLIKHVQLVSATTGGIYPANVLVYDGMIVHVEYKDLDADLGKIVTIVNGQGHYLIPGSLDVHEHIESSMMTPRNFAETTLPHGTTTMIIDPYEIVNMWGMGGVRYMHDSGEDLPVRQLTDIPSCVPAVPGLENVGADFLAEQIEKLCDLKHAIGLTEVMDSLAVIHSENCMMDILKATEDRGLYMQRHAPYADGRVLSAYPCGGPNTYRETRVSDEGLEKLCSAIYVDARDSSVTRNVKDIWEGVKQVKFLDHLCLCTGDRETNDILNSRHMNDVVRSAIRCGMDLATATKNATYNTAHEIKIENLGAVAPGSVADIPLVGSPEELKPSHVLYNGELVAENGKLLANIEDEGYVIEHHNSMHVRELSVKDLRIQAPVENGTAKVNLTEYKDLLPSSTLVNCGELPVENGYLKLSDDDLKPVAVANRHEGHDTVALDVVRGFGITTGVLASTVSHDSHNLMIVYDTAGNTLLVANKLAAREGGMCVVKDGAMLHTSQLPLAGLISLKPAEELVVDNTLMKGANRALGLVDMENPLLRVVILALPVTPEAEMSDPGLIDALKKEIVPLSV